MSLVASCLLEAGTLYNLWTALHNMTGLWSRSRRLSLETVLRRTNVSSREKLSTSRSRLGLSHLRLVPKTMH